MPGTEVQEPQETGLPDADALHLCRRCEQTLRSRQEDEAEGRQQARGHFLRRSPLWSRRPGRPSVVLRPAGPQGFRRGNEEGSGGTGMKRKPFARQLQRVRRICLSLPDTMEKISHGEPTFFVRKRVFAMFSNNHHNDCLLYTSDAADERSSV